MEYTRQNVFDIIDNMREEYENRTGKSPSYLVMSRTNLDLLKYWMMELGAGHISILPNNYAGYPILIDNDTDEFKWVGE